MKKSNLSAVVLTSKGDASLERSLKSVSFCDEIIVVADNPDRKTKELARRYKAIFFQRSLNGNFAAQRNFALQKSSGEWILFVDDDEEISNDLKDEIIRKINKENDRKIIAYYIKRRDFWWGRELKFGEVKKVRSKGLIRLVRKNSGRWHGLVHEVYLPHGSCDRLQAYINHFPHQSIGEFLKDINYYSSLRAKELLVEGNSVNLLEIIFFPLAKFLLNYFINMGFRDGEAGFAYAFLMSFHSFLVRAKLYQYLKLSARHSQA